jgi:hypothetical protein
MIYSLLLETFFKDTCENASHQGANNLFDQRTAGNSGKLIKIKRRPSNSFFKMIIFIKSNVNKIYKVKNSNKRDSLDNNFWTLYALHICIKFTLCLVYQSIFIFLYIQLEDNYSSSSSGSGCSVVDVVFHQGETISEVRNSVPDLMHHRKSIT